MEEVQDDDIDKVFLQIQMELQKIEPDTKKPEENRLAGQSLMVLVLQ